jgi:hypothetical protein
MGLHNLLRESVIFFFFFFKYSRTPITILIICRRGSDNWFKFLSTKIKHIKKFVFIVFIIKQVKH